MRIDKINLYKVLLPFSVKFSHSIRKRLFTKNIVVEIISDTGEIKGYGEGAPRSYVTGETQESAAYGVQNLIGKNQFPWELNDVSQIWDFVDSLPNGKGTNSAVCALETALLDALARKQDRYILEYFPQDFFVNSIHYGAAIPFASGKKLMDMCGLVKKIGLKKLKLKMGRDFEQNRNMVETLSLILGDGYDLKVDINGAWDYELALAHIPILKEYNVKVVEQPMMPDDPDIAEFSGTIRGNGIILMADESACSLDEVKRIIKEGYYKMVNIRLSKCGGFRRSFKIIDYLRRRGLSFQIGCQLGETGLLSAAGRALSLLCGDAAYYDGSYDAYLLKENITVKDVSFGPGGKAGPLNGPGLGVEVSKEKLERMSDLSSKITIMRPTQPAR
ncbi:mandelate racemase/muconate lactonizing enzyme family protein [Thermodesulfobacteriota bacterium]